MELTKKYKKTKTLHNADINQIWLSISSLTASVIAIKVTTMKRLFFVALLSYSFIGFFDRVFQRWWRWRWRWWRWWWWKRQKNQQLNIKGKRAKKKRKKRKKHNHYYCFAGWRCLSFDFIFNLDNMTLKLNSFTCIQRSARTAAQKVQYLCHQIYNIFFTKYVFLWLCFSLCSGVFVLM